MSERTFSDTELEVLVADRVAREVATATQRVSDLEAELDGLRTKLDVTEAAVATEKAARETAEQALTDFKVETEAREAATLRRDERATKVREAASHLDDQYFTDERVNRWAAMPDEEFAAYVAEVAELSKGVVKTSGDTKPPRETAMTGQAPTVSDAEGDKSPALRRFLGLGATTSTEKES